MTTGRPAPATSEVSLAAAERTLTCSRREDRHRQSLRRAWRAGSRRSHRSEQTGRLVGLGHAAHERTGAKEHGTDHDEHDLTPGGIERREVLATEHEEP